MKKYNENYISVKSTESVKGIFIILVFLSHISNMFINNPNYTSDLINKPYIIIQSHLGQSIVVLFLIYSGFGVTEAIKSRGISYIKTFPKKRIFKTWYHFAAAVIIYLLLNIALNGVSKFSISKILLSLTGWESLGNSNWYIFAVLCLY
ncbi:MAG: hypothetical protein LUG21_08450, partial [Clostridiales bacterium]|nr:hypothetical protein [Clostridiales bacterium]